jgi:phage major head subunit gpT-like protein
MPGIITTGSFTKTLWPGVNQFYGMAYDEHKTEYTEVFTKETSSKAYEEDVGMSGFGLAPIKTQGGSVSYDSATQGFVNRYTHVTYGLGFVITEEAIEDDQYMDKAKKFAKALAFSMRQTKEIVAANILNRAFSSSYTFGDGKELCATDHPNVAGGTFANELSVSADLSQVALEQAAIDIMNFTNDRGLKVAIMPKKLIIPTALAFEAERILKSSLEYSTANNAINPLRSMNVFPEGYAVNHYLTDADAWFITTNCPDGMKYFERRADNFAPAENDYDTGNARFKATGRYSFGVTDVRGCFGSPGA